MFPGAIQGSLWKNVVLKGPECKPGTMPHLYLLAKAVRDSFIAAQRIWCWDPRERERPGGTWQMDGQRGGRTYRLHPSILSISPKPFYWEPGRLLP